MQQREVKKNVSQGLRHTGDNPALPLPFKRTLCELTPGAVTPGMLVPLWLVCLRSLLVTRCACRWQRRGLRSGAHALCVATHTHIHTENWFFTHVEVLSHSICFSVIPGVGSRHSRSWLVCDQQFKLCRGYMNIYIRHLINFKENCEKLSYKALNTTLSFKNYRLLKKKKSVTFKKSSKCQIRNVNFFRNWRLHKSVAIHRHTNLNLTFFFNLCIYCSLKIILYTGF